MANNVHLVVPELSSISCNEVQIIISKVCFSNTLASMIKLKLNVVGPFKYLSIVVTNLLDGCFLFSSILKYCGDYPTSWMLSILKQPIVALASLLGSCFPSSSILVNLAAIVTLQLQYLFLITCMYS